ncbi:hypothetical protein GEV33_010644 [Tenebrio molitor]|uniref:Uncharacterized protein n=1 Tax=Tenebrio molitor TaxID=7067 RepID=A0A8J6HCX2_TENMO|nr:hypothetical protein GEV33_010644 [Tenebrio molitor]
MLWFNRGHGSNVTFLRFCQGSVEAFLEEKKKRKRTGEGRTGRQGEEEEEAFQESKKTARSPEVEKKTDREMEMILEKLEEMKVEIREEIKELRKENQERRLEKARFEEQHVEKVVVELKEAIEKATTKKEIIVKEAKGVGRKNEWWDKEFEQLKKEAVKELREWKRTKIDRNRFQEAKRRYLQKERCREKKNQKREGEEKEIKKIRTEKEWGNKMQERKEYFMKLLERKKEEGKAETEMEKNQKEPEETEIRVEEVERQMRKLKKKKTPGRDGVQNEVWMYGTEGILERMVKLMNAVWSSWTAVPEKWTAVSEKWTAVPEKRRQSQRRLTSLSLKSNDSFEFECLNSYLYIKDAKSYFDEPREKLSPRALCGRGKTISRSSKDFVAKVYTTFCVQSENL